MRHRRIAALLLVTFVGGLVLISAGGVNAAPASAFSDKKPVQVMDDSHRASARKLMSEGVKFLMSQKESDGGWSLGHGANKPAITAMVLKALLQHPDYNIDSKEVAAALKVLLKYQQADGGFYDPRMGLANYTTSISIMALSSVGDERYKDVIAKAVKFLRGEQIRSGSETPKGEKIKKGHKFEGGVSYGKHGRPDLSNQGMWMEAMHDAGVKADDPDMKRAVAFVTRLQNRKESASSAFVASGPNDGGFVYAHGESKAGKGVGARGLRSYGTMTYVGFKSMLYAGLDKDDPRVAAAMNWIRRHWRLDSNPNMPKKRSQQGVYYYYYVFAKALRVWGQVEIADTQGKKHNWRNELVDQLAKRVGKDGSWVNEGASRWNEGNKVLATCYSVLALQDVLIVQVAEDM